MTNTTRQRVVILPGPHKTGSSSVQSFLVSLKTKNLLGSFDWPAADRPKAFAPLAKTILFDKDDRDGSLRRNKSRIMEIWERGQSIVIGAEVLDYVAAMTPNGLSAVFERLSSILPNNADMQVAVMYRTPRASHLVSAWKQQLAMAERGIEAKIWRTKLVVENKTSTTTTTTEPPPTLAEWLCHGEWNRQMSFNVDKIISAQVNPMGIAYAFLKYGNNVNVTIADMSGIEDLPNAVACEILDVPCTDNGKVVGLEDEEVLMLFQRDDTVELRLSHEEMIEVEDVLRRMDCYYYCALRGNVTILHAKDEMFTKKEGWKDCCMAPEKFLSALEANDKLKGIGCLASGEGGAVAMRSKATSQTGGITEKVSIVLNRESKDEVDSLAFPGFAIAILFLAFVVSCFRFRRRKKLPKNEV